jgi:hypothetical protein
MPIPNAVGILAPRFEKADTRQIDDSMSAAEDALSLVDSVHGSQRATADEWQTHCS